jgi:hypothetical protein
MKLWIGAAVAAISAALLPATAAAQQTFTLKFSVFVGEGASTSRMFKA